jgi:cytochrome c
MLKYLSLIIVSILATTPIFADSKLGLGRTALPSEITAWDVDILPDGRGLPVGNGDAIVGEETFANKCASCHGDFAEGVGNWPALA